jgi:predicted Zn-dependent protease
VDRVLEEVIVHADDPDYREDLLALIELLSQTKDPEAEEKILQVINSDETPRPAAELLEGFLRNTRRSVHQQKDIPEPWKSLAMLYEANLKYLAAAKLFDSGRKAEAKQKLQELMKDQPGYPLAIMLQRFLM